jgi:hypothetical protein
MLAKTIRRDRLPLASDTANCLLDEYDDRKIRSNAFPRDGHLAELRSKVLAKRLLRLFEDSVETGVLCAPEHRCLDVPRGAAQHPELE